MSSFRQLWFLRIFGVFPLQLMVSSAGFVFGCKRNPGRLIPWESFSSGPSVHQGLFFSRVDLRFNDQQESIGWLRKSTSQKLRDDLYRHLLNLHGERAKASLSHVASLVKKSGYLRTSQAKAIIKAA